MIKSLAVLVAMTFATSAHADVVSDAVGRYKVASSSTIHFSVAQLGGAPVEGQFKSFDGSFAIEPDITRSRVEFSLKPASVSAVDPRVEAFMKSEAVFNADVYPTVTFRSTHVTRTGANTARVEGQLTAKGLTRMTEFQVEFLKREGKSLRFHVTGKLSRQKFNMDVGVPIYSNQVELDLNLLGIRRN